MNRGGPDDLLKVIREDGWPVEAHGSSAFNGNDQLFLCRHIGDDGLRSREGEGR